MGIEWDVMIYNQDIMIFKELSENHGDSHVWTIQVRKSSWGYTHPTGAQTLIFWLVVNLLAQTWLKPHFCQWNQNKKTMFFYLTPDLFEFNRTLCCVNIPHMVASRWPWGVPPHNAGSWRFAQTSWISSDKRCIEVRRKNSVKGCFMMIYLLIMMISKKTTCFWRVNPNGKNTTFEHTQVGS